MDAAMNPHSMPHTTAQHRQGSPCADDPSSISALLTCEMRARAAPPPPGSSAAAATDAIKGRVGAWVSS